MFGVILTPLSIIYEVLVTCLFTNSRENKDEEILSKFMHQ